ncbi:MAG: protein CpxP [Sediminicola sp.]|jgi:protein CpxP|tara:strand:+ start:1263 stop:1739 length:477 start_codon:yes stop_codon:yes gene_type:complete
MNKKHFYTLTIVGLLLVNLMLIGFITFQKKGRPHPMQPKNIIIDKLNFDNDQIASYELLISDHLNKIRQKDHEIMELKRALYEQLRFDNNASVVDSVTTQISNIQKKIEQIHYDHFKEIKLICNSAQQESYSQLTEEISHIFSKKPPKLDRGPDIPKN